MKRLTIFLIFTATIFACKPRDGAPRTPRPDVPISININLRENPSLNFINLDSYRFQLANELDRFQRVNFVLVDNSENPELILDLNINFTLWPRDERVSRRTASRNILAGQDAAGRPVYQTVTATYDIIQIQRRSNARIEAALTIQGDTPLKFRKSFFPSYNYVNTYVDNIRGDSRALDPSITMSRSPGFEPREEDFLLILSQEEMLRRLGSEISKYYEAKLKGEKIN